MLVVKVWALDVDSEQKTKSIGQQTFPQLHTLFICKGIIVLVQGYHASDVLLFTVHVNEDYSNYNDDYSI